MKLLDFSSWTSRAKGGTFTRRRIVTTSNVGLESCARNICGPYFALLERVKVEIFGCNSGGNMI